MTNLSVKPTRPFRTNQSNSSDQLAAATHLRCDELKIKRKQNQLIIAIAIEGVYATGVSVPIGHGNDCHRTKDQWSNVISVCTESQHIIGDNNDYY